MLLLPSPISKGSECKSRGVRTHHLGIGSRRQPKRRNALFAVQSDANLRGVRGVCFRINTCRVSKTNQGSPRIYQQAPKHPSSSLHSPARGDPTTSFPSMNNEGAGKAGRTNTPGRRGKRPRLEERLQKRPTRKGTVALPGHVTSWQSEGGPGCPVGVERKGSQAIWEP